MAEFKLHGYLTTGKFHVNDYTIEIERVSEGVRLTVTDGEGKVQKAVVKDGDAGMTEAEIKAARELYETMRDALAQWQTDEEARKAAEKDRNTAEGKRQNLYDLMLALYNRLYPKVDDDLAAIRIALADAQQAKADAEEAARRAQAATVSNDIATQIFYFDEDKIIFSQGGVGVEENGTFSRSLNLSGYTTVGRTKIVLKIPVAKRLDNIWNVTCESFRAHICNTGGYAMNAKSNADGYQYKDSIDSLYVDKVQNCIHIEFKKDGGWTLKGNECVSARIGKDSGTTPAIQFTLHGVKAPGETEE